MGLLMFEKSLTIVRWFLLVPKIDVHELMSFGRLIEGEAALIQPCQCSRSSRRVNHPSEGWL
jgi:hypothetical protein